MLLTSFYLWWSSFGLSAESKELHCYHLPGKCHIVLSAWFWKYMD